MSDNKIIDEIRVEFYNMVLKIYNEYSSDRTVLNKEIYTMILGLYTKLNKTSSIYDVKVCLKDIRIEIDKLIGLYNQKLILYRTLDKNSNDAKLLYRDIKDIFKMSQALTDAFSTIKIILRNSKLVKDNVVSSDNNTEVNSVVNPVENKSDVQPVVTEVNKKKDENIPLDMSNDTVNEIRSLSNQIASINEKLKNLNVESPDAIKLRKSVVELCDRREKILFDIFGYEGINYIKKIESHELRVANARDISVSEQKSLNEEEYLKELENVIRVLGDIRFNGIRSKYIELDKDMTKDQMFVAYTKANIEASNKFFNLTTSLFNVKHPVIFSSDDYSLTTVDLFTHLSIYNLDGGFQDFKKHHKTGKVGNEVVSKELYSNGVDKINGMISSLKTLSAELIAKNGGKVTIISNASEKSKIKAELDQMFTDLYYKIKEESNQKEF